AENMLFHLIYHSHKFFVRQIRPFLSAALEMIFREIFVLDQVFQFFNTAVSGLALRLVMENVQLILKMVNSDYIPVNMVLHYRYLAVVILNLFEFDGFEMLNGFVGEVPEKAV